MKQATARAARGIAEALRTETIGGALLLAGAALAPRRRTRGGARLGDPDGDRHRVRAGRAGGDRPVPAPARCARSCSPWPWSTTRTDLVGLGLLAGVGFTVSLLIGELGFGAGSARDEHVRLAVLVASVLASALAAVVLVRRNSVYRERLTSNR